MKDRHVRTNLAVQSSNATQVATTSERKLKANRENAKKSTGPRTPRGKAFSRRNAVKHGMFVNFATDFEALHENPKEYQELLDGLWDQYQPVGRAEEVEVERIALCYWRLKRTWRYENAMNFAATRDFVGAELNEQLGTCEEVNKEQAILAQLQLVKKEIEATRHVSDDLKQRIFAIHPNFETAWLVLDRRAQERMEEADVAKAVRKLSPQWRSWARALYCVTLTIALLKRANKRRWTDVMEAAVGRHAIPNSEALDRILRYETTIEKYRSRAIEQLDRLQRRRKGELVPPTMRVHLT